MSFDITAIEGNLSTMWNRKTITGEKFAFGLGRNPHKIYLDYIVEDRMVLTHGFKLLNDELKFAPPPVGANFGLPTVITTLAHTICGDRLNQGQPIESYRLNVESRFGTLSEMGELKIERFFPAGGGAEDGKTLAHVTVAHAADKSIKDRLYTGNPASYILYNFDLQTHTGRIDTPQGSYFGKAYESPFREERLACGAIVGAISHFDEKNADHRRIRRDLGEDNFRFLSENKVFTEEGIDITFAVTSAIVAIQGMYNTIEGLKGELDQRSVAHLTASMNVNRVSMVDTVTLLARATMFNGQIKVQGLGTDISKYGGRKIKWHDDTRLLLIYDGCEPTEFPIETVKYVTKDSK